MTGRPDQVHNCTVANTSMTSFSLRCSEGFNGGLKQSFLLELRESNSQLLRANVTSPVPRFSVGGLEPGAHYQACVYSYNMKGRSEAVPVQAATLRLPEKQLTSEKERPRAGFRFTPMMSVLIGVVSALIIVALVVSVVLRLQCSRNEDRRKRHKAAAADHDTPSIAGDKSNGSPIGKTDAGGAESGDSDEKNPDIIPQPNTDSDDHMDYLRKRQHISTIETMSPSRGLLQATMPEYTGYCTLRNGMPMKDLGAINAKQKMSGDGMYAPSGCTLPRQHWPSYAGGVAGVRHPTLQYPSPGGGHHHPPHHHPPHVVHRPDDEQATAETPLMITKRESTV